MNYSSVKIYSLWLLLAITLCGLSGASFSSVYAASTPQARLDETLREISALRARLNIDEGSLKTERSKLEALDLAYVKQTSRLNDLIHQHNESKTKLSQLQQEHTQKTEELATHRHQLSQQLVSAYQRGRHDGVKLLLNQNTVHHARRQLTYYRYLNRARLDVILETTSHLELLQQLEKQIEQKTDQLSLLLTQTETEHHKIATTRQDRAELIEHIAKKIDTQEARLEQLVKDKEKLEVLVNELRTLFADIPDEIDEQHSFSQLKGKLAWPVAQAKKQTSHANGVLLHQTEGTPVHAIAQGRVIFSDWFRGLGFLVIVDHGKNYMSLYGHNQSLLVGLGQWVRRGETIALVGQSGGAAEPALYFEIRANGKPEKPNYWCRSSKKER